MDKKDCLKKIKKTLWRRCHRKELPSYNLSFWYPISHKSCPHLSYATPSVKLLVSHFTPSSISFAFSESDQRPKQQIGHLCSFITSPDISVSGKQWYPWKGKFAELNNLCLQSLMNLEASNGGGRGWHISKFSRLGHHLGANRTEDYCLTYVYHKEDGQSSFKYTIRSGNLFLFFPPK